MSTGHVIVIDPPSPDLDPEDWDIYEADELRLVHIHVGGGCDGWREECQLPHLWMDALLAITDDEGTDEATRDLAQGMVDDAEEAEHVWHGEHHEYHSQVGWTVPTGGCGWTAYEYTFDYLPRDLPPGVYEVALEQFDWGDTSDVMLVRDPDPALIEQWEAMS